MVSELSRQKTVATQCANRTIYGAAKTAISTKYLDYLLSVSKLSSNGQVCAEFHNDNNNNNNLTRNKKGRKCYICSSKNHLSTECPIKPKKPKIEKDGLEKYKNIIKAKYINNLMRDVTPYIFKLKPKEVLNKMMEDNIDDRNQAIQQIKDNHYKVYKQKVTNQMRIIMKELHQKYNMKSQYNGKIYNYLKGLIKCMIDRKIRNSVYNEKVIEVKIEERKEIKRQAKKNKNKRSHARRRYNKLVNNVIENSKDKFVQQQIDKIERLANDLKIEEAKLVFKTLEDVAKITTFERQKIHEMIGSAEYKQANKSNKIKKKTEKKQKRNAFDQFDQKDNKKASKVARSTILKKNDEEECPTIKLLKTKKILELTPEECEQILKIKDAIVNSNDDIMKMRYKMVEERYSFFVSINYFKVKAVKQQKDKEIRENKQFKNIAENIIFENTHKPEDSIKLVEELYPNNYENQLEYLELHDKEAAQILVERAFGIEPQNHETSQEREYYIDENGEYHYYSDEEQGDDYDL